VNDGKPVKGEDFCNYMSESTLIREKRGENYFLHIPLKITEKYNEPENKLISLDPGIRTFMTGISENKSVRIGSGVRTRLQREIKKLEYVKRRKKIRNRKRKLKKQEKKLVNLTTELHWKTIKYLTDNYETILVGDLSAKSICNNQTSTLDKMTKKIAYKLSFYKFRERLRAKCYAKGNNYKKVHERYTSKTCSVCGNYNENLKKEEIYKCVNKQCGLSVGRDDTGARCIYFASLSQ
jgi:putative transposase